MSKSSKRRLARAAKFNNPRPIDLLTKTGAAPAALSTRHSALPSPAKSLHQAAAQTAAFPQRATDIPVGVPLPCSSALNSELSTFNLHSSSSTELSNLKSPSASLPPTPPLCHSATSPLPPDPPSTSSLSHSVTSSLLSFSSAPSTQHSALCLESELPHIQSRLRTAMREWCPSDPRFKSLLETYNTILQNITFERLTSTLPMLDNKNWVETNKQIVRLHAIMERTHARHSREQRERDTQVRREAREKQRIERQIQKQAEALARNQRTQQREEQRRQREQANAERDQQRHELAMRKLDIKERTFTEREKEKQEKLEHHNSAKSKESPTPTSAPKPVGPPNTWTCG